MDLDARLGARSLKIDGGNNGQHFMDYKGELGELATRHFGRVFMKVAVPAPWPADGVLHADFIEIVRQRTAQRLGRTALKQVN